MARPRIRIEDLAARRGCHVRRQVSAPPDWWERVEAFADSRGMPLAAALRELVDRGMGRVA